MAEDTCNMEDPMKKRIKEEFVKIKYNPSNDFKVCKLKWNPYEWGGAIRGPSGTEFEDGIYHVRILFAMGYPWEIPSFIFLSENGSFKIKTNVGLEWEPAKTMRQAFLELIELMDKCPHFKSGSVEYNKEKRRDLAKKSRAAAPKYGSYERQKLIDLNHQHLQRETRNTSLTQKCEEEVVVDRVGSTQMESDRSVIVEDKCNIKNPGEKRIQEEYNDIKSNPSYDFTCLKLDWNPYEWQFAIRGPSGTEFEGGIYHGIVQFSKGYPSNPPSIVFLTESGWFDSKTSISLGQSSLSVRETLIAFIEKWATDSNGELVSVENNREERLLLAIKSRQAAPKYGTFARQQVIDEIHQLMLSNAQPDSVPQLIPVPSQPSNGMGCSSVVHNIWGFVSYNTVRDNLFNVSKSNRVGVMDSMNGPPNAMITKCFWVAFFFAFLGVVVQIMKWFSFIGSFS